MQFFSADHTLVIDLRELRARPLFGSACAAQAWISSAG
jgi:hypothetical protein